MEKQPATKPARAKKEAEEIVDKRAEEPAPVTKAATEKKQKAE